MPTVRTSPPAAKAARRPRAFTGGACARWKLYVALGIAIPALIVFTLVGYYYVSFSRMIDARLHGEVQRTDPRIFARPFVVRRGQRLTRRR